MTRAERRAEWNRRLPGLLEMLPSWVPSHAWLWKCRWFEAPKQEGNTLTMERFWPDLITLSIDLKIHDTYLAMR